MTDPPRELLDPDGEGIYLYDDGSFPGVIMRAALLFFGDWREWKNIEAKSVYMRPSDDGEEWFPASTNGHPRNWRLMLPRQWRPVLFTYCAPKAQTQ